MTPLLEARALIKHLGGRRVVDGVDLVCLPGQIHGLLGPNGAGKTTTLRMLYGFLTPDGGEIRFQGADVRGQLEAAKRYIGVCTQDDTFDGDFTVEQNLLVAAEYFRPRPGPASATGSTTSSTASSCAHTRARGRRRCREAIAGASCSRGRSCIARGSSSSTSPRPASTPRPASPCGSWSTGYGRKASRSSSPRTTWTRRNG